MIPACDHTGTPLHFHSSTTSGWASLMRLRTRASVSPRQSLSSLILASISSEGEAPPSSFEPLFLFTYGCRSFLDVVVGGLLRHCQSVCFSKKIINIEVGVVLPLHFFHDDR